MPRRTTPQASPYQRVIRLAAGLHCPVRRRPFFFGDFTTRLGRPRRRLTIGRRSRSDIRMSDAYVSSRHAILECQDGGRVLVMPDSPTNGLYADGRLITEPTLLTVGMRLHLGYSRLIAVDESGRFTYSAEDYDDFLVRGGEYYGSNSLAGEKIGRSHETIRKRRPGQRPGRSRGQASPRSGKKGRTS